MTLGEKIRNARLNSKLTQEALAREVDITLNTMYRIEKNKMSPTFPIVAKIAKVLNISLDSLVN
jgi:DNA-binding XRE family transcriptional regulator